MYIMFEKNLFILPPFFYVAVWNLYCVYGSTHCTKAHCHQHYATENNLDTEERLCTRPRVAAVVAAAHGRAPMQVDGALSVARECAKQHT